MNRALIAMSGGVDSSVSALLMQRAGYDCIGATMKLHNEPAGGCGSLSEVQVAESVAQRLNMPFYIFDFSDSFADFVINSFTDGYMQGKTPNPCVECNRRLKFGRLLEKMREFNCDVLATGHYARVEYDEKSGKWLLKKAADSAKDQSYVLFMLTQEQLCHIRFPLGELTKPQVREEALKNGFQNAGKRDSQDICFVPDGDYAGFIERRTGARLPDGLFVGRDGHIFGKSKSIIHYTVGQRRGLGIAYTKPLYVCDIDPRTNKIILGDNAELFTDTLTADRVNIISGERLTEPVRVCAKVRYRHTEQPATAWQTDDGLLHIKFDEPQRAVTRGQYAVIYDGDTVIGGGEII